MRRPRTASCPSLSPAVPCRRWHSYPWRAVRGSAAARDGARATRAATARGAPHAAASSPLASTASAAAAHSARTLRRGGPTCNRTRTGGRIVSPIAPGAARAIGTASAAANRGITGSTARSHGAPTARSPWTSRSWSPVRPPQSASTGRLGRSRPSRSCSGAALSCAQEQEARQRALQAAAAAAAAAARTSSTWWTPRRSCALASTSRRATST